MPRPLIVIRGGGDLGSGVAIRLKKSGFPVVITELPQPLCVRRLVCFSQAVVAGEYSVEGVHAEFCPTIPDLEQVLIAGKIPVLVDPDASLARQIQPEVWVDARMMKHPPETKIGEAPLMIGLGPGFTAGVDCDAVVETNRGHRMGRVYWEGATEPDTGVPESVRDYRVERVLRAPADGILRLRKSICEQVRKGETIYEVGGISGTAPFDGVLRGILPDGQQVRAGLKIGDLDPRGDPSICRMVSDKALAVGGGVLEAILSRPAIRKNFFKASGK